MNSKEKLFEDWKECLENIRFYRNQMNKLSIWELGLLPLIGISVAIKFMSDYNFLFSGLTLIVLYFIMGFVDNLTHINARYSLINIKIGQEIEDKLGTKLVSSIGNRWNKKLEEDKTRSSDKRFDTWLFHVNKIKKIKYFIVAFGLILVIISFI